MTIQDFADKVQRAVNQSHGAEVFGSRKVFISHLWRRLKGSGVASSGADFKARLAEAHRLGLLTLARADFTQAMAPHEVADSEVSHLESRYHFVERKPPAETLRTRRHPKSHRHLKSRYRHPKSRRLARKSPVAPVRQVEVVINGERAWVGEYVGTSPGGDWVKVRQGRFVEEVPAHLVRPLK